MSRFARTEQEVFLRRKELIDAKRRQGYLATLELYQLILLHSWGTGKSDKNLKELCEIYGLERHNTNKRYKILREKGWVEDTDKYIRPLLVHRPREKENNAKPAPPADEEQIVNSTSESGVKITPAGVKITPAGVKITPAGGKIHPDNGQNGVNFTPNNGVNRLTPSDSGDAIPFLKFKPDLKATASSSSGDKYLSEFSQDECLRWMQIRAESGEDIPPPDQNRIALWAYRTGEADSFIYAALYPDGLDERGNFVPRRLGREKLGYFVENLRSLSDEEFDPEAWRRDFHRDDWQYLMEVRSNEHAGRID